LAALVVQNPGFPQWKDDLAQFDRDIAAIDDAKANQPKP